MSDGVNTGGIIVIQGCDESGNYLATNNPTITVESGSNTAKTTGTYLNNIIKIVSKGTGKFTISFFGRYNVAGFLYENEYSEYTNIMLSKSSTYIPYSPFVPNSPDPRYPSYPTFPGDFDLVTTNGNDKMRTIHFPYTLRAVPSGACDFIRVIPATKTAFIRRVIGRMLFTATTPYLYGSPSDHLLFYLPAGAKSNPNNIETSICSHDKWASVPSIYTGGNGIGVHYSSAEVWWRNEFFNNFSTLADVRTWFGTEQSAGRQIEFCFEWAAGYVYDEPIPYNEVVEYFPETLAYTNATVQPTLEGKFIVFGN